MGKQSAAGHQKASEDDKSKMQDELGQEVKVLEEENEQQQQQQQLGHHQNMMMAPMGGPQNVNYWHNNAKSICLGPNEERKLLGLLIKLKDACDTSGSNELYQKLNLPEIVAVGSQSSGKSSVLEGFVGFDFLPRGNGIVTRRPLKLQMNYCPIGDPRRILVENSGDVSPGNHWAKFDHSDRIYTNFEDVRKEIQRATEEHPECQGGGISAEPIKLDMFSVDMVNLSLVDLPGLTKMAQKNQPKDIEKRLTDLILNYIRKPNTIILAVTPANDDLTNSEGLKLANQVDPERKRTVLVLTKLDLMDRGTNAKETLMGQLKLTGETYKDIIGVVNRCQADVQSNVPMEERNRMEEQFFLRHYPGQAEKNGIKYLMKRLNEKLADSLVGWVPELDMHIGLMLEDCLEKKRKMPDQVKDKLWKLSKLIGDFADAYIKTIDGTVHDGEKADDKHYGGSNISEIMHGQLQNALYRLNPDEGLTIYEVYGLTKKDTGIHMNIHMRSEVFKNLVRERIQWMERPCQECIRNVHEEMLNAINGCGPIVKELKCYPKLYQKISNLVDQSLAIYLKKAEEFMHKEVKCHMAYINAAYSEFQRKNAAIKAESKKKKSPDELASGEDMDDGLSAEEAALLEEPSNHFGWARLTTRAWPETTAVSARNTRGGGTGAAVGVAQNGLGQFSREFASLGNNTQYKQECAEIIRFTKSYFNNVRKIILDKVPKAILLEIIEQNREELKAHLNKELLGSKNFDLDKLMAEHESVAEDRKRLAMKIEALMKAKELVNEVHSWLHLRHT